MAAICQIVLEPQTLHLVFPLFLDEDVKGAGAAEKVPGQYIVLRTRLILRVCLIHSGNLWLAKYNESNAKHI